MKTRKKNRDERAEKRHSSLQSLPVFLGLCFSCTASSVAQLFSERVLGKARVSRSAARAIGVRELGALTPSALGGSFIPRCVDADVD